MSEKLKMAILDLNDGRTNQGLGNIVDLAHEFQERSGEISAVDIFDVRVKNEVPNIEEYDIFVSSGGPGSPLPEGLKWEQLYFDFLDNIWEHNKENKVKKYLFLICHSFQVAINYWELAKVSERRSYSFGIMPIHKTTEGKKEFLFENLEDPFFAIDSRSFQCTEPNLMKMENLGMKITAIEKYRPYIMLERAIMSIRFSDEIFGTQFHPEADPEGFKRSMQDLENKLNMIQKYGLRKYIQTLRRIDDHDKIVRTQGQILPTFFRDATDKILSEKMEFA